MGFLGNIVSSSNNASIIGALGEKGQKYTDPLAMVLGDKYTGALRGIADKSQELAAEAGSPLAGIDKAINPVRRIPAINNIAEWTEAKPLDSLAMAIGAAYGGGALSSMFGGAGAGSGMGGLASSLPSNIAAYGQAGGGTMGAIGNFIGPIAQGVGAILGAKKSGDAAEAASAGQLQAAREGIAEQRRQFDISRQLMMPYIGAGIGSISQQQALMGLMGADAQQKAISGISSGPEFQSLIQQGENAMLQNASATGGLRGGNVQAAMAQFRPQLLSGLINQQYSRLGGLAGLGQASAAGQAAAGQNMAGNIGQLLQQGGAASAGGQLAQAAINNQLIGNLAGVAGQLFGKGGGLSNVFGGASKGE